MGQGFDLEVSDTKYRMEAEFNHNRNGGTGKKLKAMAEHAYRGIKNDEL